MSEAVVRAYIFMYDRHCWCSVVSKADMSEPHENDRLMLRMILRNIVEGFGADSAKGIQVMEEANTTPSE